MNFKIFVLVIAAVIFTLSTIECINPAIFRFCETNPEKCKVNIKYEDDSIIEGVNDVTKRETSDLIDESDLLVDSDEPFSVKDVAGSSEGPKSSDLTESKLSPEESKQIEDLFWKDVVSLLEKNKEKQPSNQ